MTPTEHHVPRPDVSLREVFWYCLKLGFISFGGPAGQIAIMHHDLVEKKGWISEKRFLHALNYCMLLPGPEAQQLATYIGWLMHRTWGGVIAGSLFVLPSLLILIVLTWIYLTYGHLQQIAGALYGIKPAVVAIVMFAAYRIGSRVLKNRFLWLITASAFIAVAVFSVPFPYVVLFAALIGYIGSRLAPAVFRNENTHYAGAQLQNTAIIDDHTPIPAHAAFRPRHMMRLLLAGLGVWAASLGVLALLFGWEGILTQMGWFFTKTALLTFGGAYAALPYINEGAVQFYGWLTPTQMIDGLALGETTPGPLIMLVAFVGFVGGWTHQIPGVDGLFLAGAMAAIVATFFTFLPSFLFVFIGGPIIESTQGDLKFTAPLTGITAAVVGVILNLALFFAYHVIWPKGWNETLDVFSLIASLLALVALFRFKVGIMQLIGVFALIGIGHHMLLA
ncbi:Chromate transport protein [Methylophilaceae bacterium]|nr:Chromate transport protein [Methylophilaceae bacterium]